MLALESDTRLLTAATEQMVVQSKKLMKEPAGH